jgi:hypothetical protein
MLRKLGLGLICTALLAACGSAQLVTQNQYGGVLRLNGDRGKAMEDAQKQMAAHCGLGNFTVVQQGEEAIGTDVIANSDTNYGEDTVAGAAGTTSTNGNTTNSSAVGASSTRGGSSTQAITSTRTATEWRVHYTCGAPGAGAGGPPPPPPPPAM